MRGSELRRVGDLADLGIAFEVMQSDVDSEVHYASEGAVSISVKAQGEAPQTGSNLKLEDAGVSFSFSRSDAAVLQLTDCTSQSIRNMMAVGTDVIALHESGKWPSGHVIVYETVLSGALTIIISSESGAAIDLAARGPVSAGPLTLASLNAALDVRSQRKIGAQFISTAGLTPLVKTVGIRRRFLREPELRGTPVRGPEEYEFG